MHESKTIQLLNKYYGARGLDRNPTDDERSLVFYIEFDIAKSIIEEFGNERALKIAQMIQTYVSN